MVYWVGTYILDHFWQKHLLKWVHVIPTHLIDEKNMFNSQNLRANTCMCMGENNIMQKSSGWHLC